MLQTTNQGYEFMGDPNIGGFLPIYQANIGGRKNSENLG